MIPSVRRSVVAEAEILQGLQADPLAVDGARILVLEAVEVDLRRPRRLLRLGQAAAVGGLAGLHVGFRGLDVRGRRFWRGKMKNRLPIITSCPCKRNFAEGNTTC